MIVEFLSSAIRRAYSRVHRGWVIAALVIGTLLTGPLQRMELAQVNPDSSSKPTGTAGQSNEPSFRASRLTFTAWPTVRFDFSIAGKNRIPINDLAVDGIAARIDNRTLAIDTTALQRAGADPTSLMLVVNPESLSILPLSVAKDSLTRFASTMSACDMASLMIIADKHRMIVPPTSDTRVIATEIGKFESGPERVEASSFYDSIDYAIRQSERGGIHNIAILSEEIPEQQPQSQTQVERIGPVLDSRVRQQTIATNARDAGIQIFALVIDNSLNKTQTQSGIGLLTQLSELLGQKAIPVEKRNGNSGLDLALSQVREAIRFDYSLQLRLPPEVKQDNIEHNIDIDLDSAKTPLRTRISFKWPRGQAQPSVNSVTVSELKPENAIASRVSFVPIRGNGPGLPAIILIYLALFFALIALAVLPQIINWGKFTDGAQTVDNPFVVDSRSGFIGVECPNERSGKPIQVQDTVFVCPDCKTAYHLGCWIYFQCRCTTRNCGHECFVTADVINRMESTSAEA